jgi:hypothetical protein
MKKINSILLELARAKVAEIGLSECARRLHVDASNLSKGMKGLTLDQMREKAADAIKAILARANEKIEPSKDGAVPDSTAALTRSRNS